MKKNSILFFLIACIIAACGNDQPEQDKPVEKATAPPPVYKMDMLEKVFNNDNWMKIDGRDTSFYYFSRIPSEIRVHKYKMIKGDSALSNISVIKFNGDSLVWAYDDTTRLFLTAVSEESCEWAKAGGSAASFFMAFEKKDDKHIQVNAADKGSFILTRTPPLSTFLIRSRYDQLHGTHYAFSDTVFSAEKK